MEQLFTSMLCKSGNPLDAIIDYVAQPEKDFDIRFNPIYWIHISNQPAWMTEIVRENHKDMPEACNNLLCHIKHLDLVNVIYQWD